MVERIRLKPEPKKKKDDYRSKPRRNLGGAKRGPESSYKPEYAKLAGALAERGATDADLASAFGKSTWTIKQWYAAYPEFGEAVRLGKNAVFDPKVERALAHRAVGYEVDTEEVKILSDGTEKRYQVRKHYPPDTTACIFWLKNRNPTAWRDVQDHRHTGKVELENLTAEQLLAEIRKEAAELGILPETLSRATLGVAPNSKSNGSTKH